MKKFVQLKFLATVVFAILFIGASYAQDPKVVYYVYDAGRTDPATGVTPEQPIVDAIELELGYEVNMFPTVMLENATEEELNNLRGADLIIIGRAVFSGNWTAAGRTVWNSLTTPVLSTNAFASRMSHLGWIGAERFGGADDAELVVTANVPNDPIFAGVTLDDEDQFHLWTGSWSAIIVESSFPGEGDIIISRTVEEGANIEVFLVRFDAGTPFMNDEVPAGPRAYMGLGVDGDDNFRYWNYSDDGAQIFLAEVERMANLEKVPVDVDPIYSITFALPAGDYNYKYFLVGTEPTWDLGEWTGDPNRSVTVSAEVTIEDTWGDQPVVAKAVGAQQEDIFLVTFTVDMTDAVVGEGETAVTFNPALHSVFIAGSFPGDLEWNQPGSNPALELTIGNTGVVSVPAVVVQDQKLRLFPNPASTNFTIATQSRISQILVSDVTGRTIQSVNADGYEVKLDTSSMRNGIYIVSVYTDNGIAVSKLQVQR